MPRSKFVQVLRVEDYRIETGVEAQPGARGAVSVFDVIRVWLVGTPALPHASVTQAFLEARSDVTQPTMPSYDFQRRRILLSYTLAGIQPVVSLLLDGVQLYCQYRELEGGAIHADVHLPRRNRPPHEDAHWVRED